MFLATDFLKTEIYGQASGARRAYCPESMLSKPKHPHNSSAKIGLFPEFAKLNPPVPLENPVHLGNRFGPLPVRLVGENEVEEVLLGETSLEEIIFPGIS